MRCDFWTQAVKTECQVSGEIVRYNMQGRGVWAKELNSTYGAEGMRHDVIYRTVKAEFNSRQSA